MPTKARLLELVLDAYREGDLDECIRLVRTLVEAAPQATAPRQLLAALFASTGNGRLALAQYKRLLPDAVARGEVIRAIAFQKQIDVFESPESLGPGRWMSLQRQLRERGMPMHADAPGAPGRPWSEAQLLALPRAWFERVAAETRFEILGLAPRVVDVDAGTVWEVLAGRMRWSFALPDGRASAEALAADGDAVHVDQGLSRSARVTMAPELPIEALRFDAELARDLMLALSAGLHVAGSPMGGLTSETRALLPTRPRRREDLDDAPRAPQPNGGTAPPRLPTPSGDGGGPAPAGGDGAGWVEFGVLSLAGTPASGGPDNGMAVVDDATVDHAAESVSPGVQIPIEEPAERIEESASLVTEAMADAPVAENEVLPEAAPSAPAIEEVADPVEATAPLIAEPPMPVEATVFETPETPTPVDATVLETPETPGSVDAAEELVHASSRAPLTPVFGDAGSVVERRRHPRVTVAIASRVALLRLAGSGLDPVEGHISDLSTSGFNIRFTSRDLGASRGALADAVVAVDMDLPGPHGGLRVAAQVRWLDADDARDEARLGIEFVLLTETDRRRIAGTLARAALALREQERKAA